MKIKKTLAALATLVTSNATFHSSANALVSLSVDGYYKGNGTFIAPHYKTSPDDNAYTNFSYKG